MMTTVTIPQVETPDAEKLEDLSVMASEVTYDGVETTY